MFYELTQLNEIYLPVKFKFQEIGNGFSVLIFNASRSEEVWYDSEYIINHRLRCSIERVS